MKTGSMRRADVIQAERETSGANQRGPEPSTPYDQRKTGSMRREEVIQAERETSRAISRVRNLIHQMVRGRQVG
jgi:hypothetical protein